MDYQSFIKDYQHYGLNPDLLNTEIACQLLTTATAFFASINTEIARAEIAYKKKKFECLQGAKSAAAAKMAAEATSEYGAFRKAELDGDSILEIIRSLKKIKDRGEEEYKHQPR